MALVSASIFSLICTTCISHRTNPRKSIQPLIITQIYQYIIELLAKLDIKKHIMIGDNDLIRLTYTTKRHRSGTSMRTSKRDEVLDLVPGTIRIITYCTENW